jgi:acetyl esterase
MADQKKPILEPTTQAFVDALAAQGGKPLYELSYADARRVLEDAQAIEGTKLPADVEEKTLPVGPGERFRYASIVQRAPRGFCRS